MSNVIEKSWRGYSQSDFDATYSPEDDKLRVYTSTRLDAEEWKELKSKFNVSSAPTQGCFYFKWSPSAEDFCLELCGSIEREETTLAERAEAKAERLDGYADSNRAKSSTFAEAAHRIGQRFYMGQPILIGHHSEKSARRDKKRMESAQRNSIQCAERVNYWNYRASGVERHANMKSSNRTRRNRIKKLLADLRTHQRTINHGFILFEHLDTIYKLEGEEQRKHVLTFSGYRLKTGETCAWGTWDDLSTGKITTEDAIGRIELYAEAHAYGRNRSRVIQHLLNRLGYERTELGEVNRFEGELTPVIIQGFARTHGADKPKATKSDKGFLLASRVPLPAHLGDGCELDLTADAWRDLMQNCGYVVEEVARRVSKKAAAPILNFSCESITAPHRVYPSEKDIIKQESLSKEEYSRIRKDYKGTRLSICGNFRFRVAFIKDEEAKKSSFGFSWRAIFINDQKAHPLPVSEAVTMPAALEALPVPCVEEKKETVAPASIKKDAVVSSPVVRAELQLDIFDTLTMSA